MSVFRNCWTVQNLILWWNFIDTVAPKCYLIYNVLQRRLPIVSSMGAGAKWDITQVRFADLWDTYHCGLSKAVRKRLQKMGMKRKLPVVFSTEQADQDAVILVDDEKNKKINCRDSELYAGWCLAAIWRSMSLNDFEYDIKLQGITKSFRVIAGPERY